ncbi:ROK family protein [Lacticaseibacillus mingshuiensis]|uniref:ROK family protein n=1 Tax=Lacticaseibacillus mingshuiensis TaxID=2799574 RepID=UPI00194F856D|nr:ROK family protein [Lacticaseibacillus mingshuiensis]
MLGAIEAGGTKFVLAVSEDGLTVEHRVSIKTTTPEETMAQVFAYFDKYPVTALGLASFGPLNVNVRSKGYGSITNTPKLPWRHYDILGDMKAHYPDVRFAFTTDVNAAAYGELKAGAAKGVQDVVYWTVGTGIGAGIVSNGKLLQGYSHPEAGHMLVRRDPRDEFAGFCPYHHDCLEGLAAGPAIEQRFGKPAIELAPDHVAWEIEANYLAQACMNVTLTVAPERIVFGGGVMHQPQLFPMIREAFKEKIADYVEYPALDDYIVPIALKDDAGVIGAFMLAKEA